MLRSRRALIRFILVQQHLLPQSFFFEVSPLLGDVVVVVSHENGRILLHGLKLIVLLLICLGLAVLLLCWAVAGSVPLRLVEVKRNLSVQLLKQPLFLMLILALV